MSPKAKKPAPEPLAVDEGSFRAAVLRVLKAPATDNAQVAKAVRKQRRKAKRKR